MSAESDLASFSCPGLGDAERPARLASLWSDYASTIVDTFVIRFGELLEERAESLLRALRGWLEAGRPIEDPAGFPVDLLLAHASGRAPEPISAGATAALHLGGEIAPFGVAFDLPRRIRWRGLISPLVRRLDYAGGVLTIEDADRRRSEITAGADAESARRAGFRVCPTIRTRSGEIALMTADYADTWGFTVENAWSSAEGEALADAIRDALELIDTHTPEYAPWVGSAVRMIVPVRRTPNADTSHSFMDYPGIVAVGMPTHRVMLGELLVHESSHLHYGAVSKGHTLTTIDDQRLYFSPFPRADRNIGMLMFGFHAFANIGIYRKGCLAAGLPATSQDFDWQSDWMPEILKVCGHLEHSPGITPAGRALWERAALRLFDGRRWS